jgi:excalibur calcium-binding domain-containing protein
MVLKYTAAVLVAACLTAGGVAGATPHHPSNRYDNCTAFNRHYPHGVGKKHAHDRTSGTPVRSFVHSTNLYRRAMAHNSDLDRDRDHIACETA